MSYPSDPLEINVPAPEPEWWSVQAGFWRSLWLVTRGGRLREWKRLDGRRRSSVSEAEWISDHLTKRAVGMHPRQETLLAEALELDEDRIVGAWWRLDALDRITGLEVVYDPRTEEEAAEGRPTTEGAA